MFRLCRFNYCYHLQICWIILALAELYNLSIWLFVAPAAIPITGTSWQSALEFVKWRSTLWLEDYFHLKTKPCSELIFIKWIELFGWLIWTNQTPIQLHILWKAPQRIVANSAWMKMEIWHDDLSMISPRYDQTYWRLNNDRAVTLKSLLSNILKSHLNR